MKIAVLTDSGSAMSISQAREKGLFLVPLQVVDGQETFTDGVDISTAQLYDRLRQNHTPKTSMPTTAVIAETIEEIKREGYEQIIAVPLSSGLSGTGQTMFMCAQQANIPITIIEIYTTCDLQGYIAEMVHSLVAQGLSADKIKELVEEKVKTSGTVVLPNDIQHLKRGGRLTPVAAAAASLLKIKPVLKIDPSTNGKIDVFGKVRTEHKATALGVNMVCDWMNQHAGMVYVIHSDNLTKAETIKKEIETRCPPVQVQINTISPVISAHTGLDCIAIQYIIHE